MHEFGPRLTHALADGGSEAGRQSFATTKEEPTPVEVVPKSLSQVLSPEGAPRFSGARRELQRFLIEINYLDDVAV